jgi:hypothetical protein
MRVCLTRKLAQMIDGVDLSNCEVGDVIDLPVRKANLLVAEEWAIPDQRRIVRAWASSRERSVAADRAPMRRPRTSVQRPSTHARSPLRPVHSQK